MERVIRIAQYITIALWVLVLLTAVICIAAYEGGTMDNFFGSVAGDILISVVSSAVTSLMATVIMYFAFLKKIPEKTRDKIDRLLNDRLNYETTNHDAVMTSLDSNSKHATLEHKALSSEHNNLSAEHTQIRLSIQETAGILREERAVREERAKHMTGSQKEIQGHVDGIRALSDVMGKQQVKIAQLRKELAQAKTQCQELRAENQELREALEQTQASSVRRQRGLEMER